MASLARFSVGDLERFSATLRTIGTGARGIEAVAARVTAYLHEQLEGLDGDPACASVALHMTHPFGRMPEQRRQQALALDPAVIATTACLTPLSIVGPRDDGWPEAMALPLTDPVFATRPILLGLLDGLGVTRETAIERTEVVRSGVHREELDAYFVPDLAGRPGITSLLGLGGGLPTGDLFVLSLLTREAITDKAAHLLRTLAPAVKATLIPHALHPWPD